LRAGATLRSGDKFSTILQMVAEENYGAHSAEVKMRLIVNGQPIRITHMGPDFLLVECNDNYPPGKAMDHDAG
jgi:hypothetical protein